ncbi:TRAP transporter large permease [Microbacterium halophytorum]|uniref:TRAP transporter large permease n=1 Tax=Microbacterium halophytorum TaxID=2067568 RepID=UPI000CFA9B6A|nr:TRAP transporter large permease [Microbacterium halophytorum]
MTLALMVVAVLVLLAIRVPVAFALLVPSLVYITVTPGVSIDVAMQQTLSGVNSFPILAVPMFILLGNIANESGITDRMYSAAVAFLGHLRGSLGYVNIATSFGFSWMSGAAIADAAAMGRVQVPQMVKRGYPAGFSVGLTGASSLIAPIIPPSIAAIVYAVTAGLSVGAMFVVGIVPAVMLLIALCVMVWWTLRKRDDLRGERATWGARGRALAAAIAPAGAAIVILGSILAGIATPTEAAGLGVVYVLILAIVYKKLTWQSLAKSFVQTAQTSGSVLLIVATAALFGWVLARERAPQVAAEAMLEITTYTVVFLIIVNVLLLVVGALLESTSAILILVPVLAPVAETFGVDPYHFAAIVIFNLLLGLLTPPVGMVLFVLSSTTGYKVSTIIRGVLPFFIPMLLVLLLVTFVPVLSTGLPALLGYV